MVLDRLFRFNLNKSVSMNIYWLGMVNKRCSFHRDGLERLDVERTRV